MIGQTISHYNIVESLGGGGMGVVYKARDTRLNRFVALKFLPPEWSRDEAAKQRFMQEARAASTLEHPNICTIYDIGETDDGQLFIAMANYEGQTLKNRSSQGPMPILEAIDIAIQMIEGLIKAHEAEIIHRDIKPANIMITNDAHVKILDFGLAKLEGEPRLTVTGTTLGTVSYMSPEQARGEEADARSDIWSVGVTIYEMVTGQLPFQGGQAAVMQAIQMVEPKPLTALRSGVPLDLERIVDRALSKRAEDRYQTMADMRSELQRVQRTMTDMDDDTPTVTMAPVEGEKTPPLTTATPTIPEPALKKRKWTLAGVLAIGIIIAGIAGIMWLLPSEPSLLRVSNARQITSSTGQEIVPTWSPDGGRLAYQSNQSGNWDIWMNQIGVGQPVNLTKDHTGNDGNPSWSPDGTQIAFWSSRDDGGIFLMPAVGGVPRKVVRTDLGSGIPRWSPDGTELAYIVRDTSSVFVEITSVKTNESRRLPLPGDNVNRFSLNWSSDGQYFVYADAPTGDSETTRIWIMHIEDGAGHPVTDGRAWDWYPSWSDDGRTLYFLSNRGGSQELWRQPLGTDLHPAEAPQPVTTGIGMHYPVFSPDGSKLAYTKGARNFGVTNIWRVPILDDRPATWEDAEQLTHDEAQINFVDVSPDGTRIVFDSDRAGNRDIWVKTVGQQDITQQVTIDSALDCCARWAPDGNRIAFSSSRSGNRDIWIKAVDGGPARQVTTYPGTDWFPVWSFDSRNILFSSNRSGDLEHWIVPMEGGTPRWVAATKGFADWSPDGQWVVFAPRQKGVWRVSPMGGVEEPVVKSPRAWYPRISPDGKTVYFFGKNTHIWSVKMADGAERQMTDLTGEPGKIYQTCLATDGHYLYFGWKEPSRGDLWVMDVTRE